MQDPDPRPLGPTDFASREDWLRYSNEAGFNPFDEDVAEAWVGGGGAWAQRFAATYTPPGDVDEAWLDRELDRPLCRGDFLSSVDWRRYLLQTGLRPDEADVRDAAGGGARCEWAALLAAAHPLDGGLRPPVGVSLFLSPAEFLDGYRAVALANLQGRLLNAFLTITWPMGGIAEDEAVRDSNSRFWGSFCLWPGLQGVPAAYLWTIERGPTRGLHTHGILALPVGQQAAFRRWCQETLVHIAGRHWAAAHNSTPFDLGLFDTRPLSRQWGAFRYLFKGFDPTVTALDPITGGVTPAWMRLKLKVSDQGWTQLERSGHAPTLGPWSVERWEAAHRYRLPTLAELLIDPERYGDRYLRLGQILAAKS